MFLLEGYKWISLEIPNREKQRFAGESIFFADGSFPAGGNFDGFRRDRGGVSRSILLYVRTRGADETGERREINPAAVTLLDIIVEISYALYDLFVMMRKRPEAGKAPKGCNLHMCECNGQWHHYC
jgi:hypothetical protein